MTTIYGDQLFPCTNCYYISHVILASFSTKVSIFLQVALSIYNLNFLPIILFNKCLRYYYSTLLLFKFTMSLGGNFINVFNSFNIKFANR